MGNQESGNILSGVVCLEIGSLISDEGIADTVSLVEGIAGKGLNKSKDLTGDLGRESVLLSSSNEVASFFLHNLRNLFAHCLTENISLPQTIASQCLHNKQHLVLVHNHPIGLLKDTGQGRVGIADGLKAVLGFDEGRNMLHWSRAIEGYHGGNITEGGGFKLLDIAAHASSL